MRSTWLTSGSLSSTHNSSESAKSLLELQRKGHAHQRNTRVDLAGQEHRQVDGQGKGGGGRKYMWLTQSYSPIPHPLKLASL